MRLRAVFDFQINPDYYLLITKKYFSDFSFIQKISFYPVIFVRLTALVVAFLALLGD